MINDRKTDTMWDSGLSKVTRAWFQKCLRVTIGGRPGPLGPRIWFFRTHGISYSQHRGALSPDFLYQQQGILQHAILSQ
jgi:hypothetical protein